MSPEHRRRCPSAEVWGVCEKHPSHTAPVVTRAHALLLGHRRHHSSAEVWGVCEKTPLPRSTRRRTGACVLARAQALPPEQGCFAQALTALVTRRRVRATAGVVARASLVCARTSEGIKGPAFPSLLTFLPSEAFWLGPTLQQLLARTSRIGLWLSFLIVLFVYVNRISAPFITFIFLITSVHSTCLASCKNGKAEERDKGVGAMVYVATGWTYGELRVLWKHNAIQKRMGL